MLKPATEMYEQASTFDADLKQIQLDEFNLYAKINSAVERGQFSVGFVFNSETSRSVLLNKLGSLGYVCTDNGPFVTISWSGDATCNS